MIIDFHTHTFPEHIAKRALKGLSDSSRTIPYTDGTSESRSLSAKQAGIDYCVNLPVATSGRQVEGINTIAINNTLNTMSNGEDGVIYFGSMHPDFENVIPELKRLKEGGVKGIKIHPAFYGMDICDRHIMNIIYEAQALDLIVVTHSGWDIGFEERNYIPVNSLLRILLDIGPKKMVLAHMGGWDDWDQVEKYLAGSDYYFDTSFSLGKINCRPDLPAPLITENMKNRDFVRLCRKHGVEKILFGTDSPWSDQTEYVKRINELWFEDNERKLIFSENASKLLFG